MHLNAKCFNLLFFYSLLHTMIELLFLFSLSTDTSFFSHPIILLLLFNLMLLIEDLFAAPFWIPVVASEERNKFTWKISSSISCDTLMKYYLSLNATMLQLKQRTRNIYKTLSLKLISWLRSHDKISLYTYSLLCINKNIHLQLLLKYEICSDSI